MTIDLEQKRDMFGFIDLSDFIDDKKKGYFYIDNDKYYFKFNRVTSEVYNELLGEEIAIAYGIPCAHYDLGSYDNFLLIFSKDVIKENDKVVDMNQLLQKYYPNDINSDKHNNLEDLWNIFIDMYKDPKLIKKLMDQIVDLFIFDVLIGNMDRHVLNYFLIENNGDVNLGTIIDNENMLGYSAIYYGGYDLGITSEDYFYSAVELEEEDNFLYKFLTMSSSEYFDYFLSKLDLISEENLINYFNNIEKRINASINPMIKKDILNRFEQNRSMISKVLDRIKNKQKIYT